MSEIKERLQGWYDDGFGEIHHEAKTEIERLEAEVAWLREELEGEQRACIAKEASSKAYHDNWRESEAEVARLQGNKERMWCLACGTVTRVDQCDCSRGDVCEPNFVNYADELQRQLQQCASENNGLEAEVAEWKQAASVEASLRREFNDEITRLRKGIKDCLHNGKMGGPIITRHLEALLAGTHEAREPRTAAGSLD